MSYKNSRLSQAEFLMWSNIICSLVQDNLSTFAAFDSERFTLSYVSNFRQSLDIAYDTLDDETVEDQQMQRTSAVGQIMKEASKTYQEFKYFVEKAFQKNEARMRELGSDDYHEASKNVNKMIIFLLKTYKVGMTYTNELNAVGCDTFRIEKLKALHHSLLDTVITQERFKGGRTVETQTRTERYDNVYEFVRGTCRAAKFIFSDNLAMYKQFLIPTKSSNNTTDNSLISVSAQTRMGIFDTPLEIETIISIENNSNVPLVFYGSTASDPEVTPTAAIIIAAGDSKTVTFSDICDDTVVSEATLYVVNSSNEKAKFRVIVLDEVPD